MRYLTTIVNRALASGALCLAIAGFPTAAAQDPVLLPAGPFGAGPDAYDNGEVHPCTGVGTGSPAVLCVRAGAAASGVGSAGAPFAAINAAIAAASAGDIIQVAAGRYPENVALGGFNDWTDKHLTLLGGFSANDFSVRDASRHRSIIDGSFADPGVRLHLQSDEITVLDGFEITRGRGLGSSWEDGDRAGGGVYIQFMGNGEVVVSHNFIHDNETVDYDSADTRGGGIHADFEDWTGDSTGLIRIENNIVRGNRAGRGAGINVRGPRAAIVGNLVEDNVGHDDHGGGIYVSTQATLVERNVVRGNVTGATQGYGWGGGVLIAAASADLYGNVITDNYAPSIGSGVFWDEGASGSMVNDLIFANRCPLDERSGAAVYVDGGPGGPSVVSMENVTIADHVCPDSTGGAVYIQESSLVTVKNSILWGNTHEFTTDDASYSISYSITAEPGLGNLSLDPLFADAANGDYHLKSTAGRPTASGWTESDVSSPAIDAGDPASDFSREPQPNGGRVDLGAYGNTPEASRSP